MIDFFEIAKDITKNYCENELGIKIKGEHIMRECEHCRVDELDGTYMINDNEELCEDCYLDYLKEFEKDLEKLLANYSFKVKASDLVDDLSGRLDKI
jgi:hypothetical protein